MMHVICFYWQGDRWQEEGYQAPEKHQNLQKTHLNRAGKVSADLASKYVNNLYLGVKRFADREFDFICFTNEQLALLPEIESRSFPMLTYSGVLPRLFMFSKEAGLMGSQVLCLDLDVIIVGSLKDLMDYDGLFCARSKFKRGEEFKLDGDVMSFQAGLHTEEIFWKPFIRDIDAAIDQTKGRERYWIRACIGKDADRWDKFAPNQILSFKRHIKNMKAVPEQAAIISCHGVPRPHQIKNNWIRDFWK